MGTIMTGYKRWRFMQLDYFSYFYEKAHFVKPTWRLYVAERNSSLRPSHYASICTVSESTLFGVGFLMTSSQILLLGSEGHTRSVSLASS
jgi:hypothetical protein